MALVIVPKKVLVFLRLYLTQRSRIHTKLKTKLIKSINYLNKHPKCLLFEQAPISVFCKLNLAHFYSFSNSLRNVSTYESLVNQKCTNSDKKPTETSHPGRHRFHKDIESALNEQILVELNAAFVYLAIASYYGRTEVALPGCQGIFMKMHEEEHRHAMIFINYVLMRGGHPVVPGIPSPSTHDWKDISKTFATAVEMESQVKEKLEAIVDLSEKHKDFQLVDFISNEFLNEQNRSICLMARLLTRSKMANDKVGEYLFDKHLFDAFVSKDNLMHLRNVPEDDNQNVYK